MSDEEFRKLCDEFNKIEAELNDVTVIFSNVDNRLHKVCDKMDNFIVIQDDNVKQEKNKQL
jgi:hypothetical protein